MGVEEARAKLGDLVRDAQQHGITTHITRNGKPAALLMPHNITLEDRVAAVLEANGFMRYSGTGRAADCMFVVSEGIGASVYTAWDDATEEDRSLMLTKFANRLRDNGLNVTSRGHYLYVAAPDTKGEPS